MTSLSLSRTAPALVALYAAGAVWAAAAGLASFGEALVNGSVINAPLVIVLAQGLGALLVVRARGRRGAVAGALLALLACSASLAAVAFDGDLGHAGLSGAQVAYQVLISAVTVLCWVGAARALRRAD